MTLFMLTAHYHTLWEINMLENLKKWFGPGHNTNPAPTYIRPDAPPAPPKAKAKPKALEKSAKELATERDEPYIAIVSLDINPDNLHEGAFDLDWNEKFVSNLVRAGYMMKKEDTDAEIVDRWFQNVCRHVVMETWEQEQAMNPQPQRYTQSRDLGGGRKEVS
jgi:hypothetical protein